MGTSLTAGYGYITDSRGIWTHIMGYGFITNIANSLFNNDYGLKKVPLVSHSYLATAII